jgi:hypothetical protein
MSDARQLFEFSKMHKGVRYTYNGENRFLYTVKDGAVDGRPCDEHTALRILTDLVFGTVHPISEYFVGHGRDSVGTCPRCGGTR